MDLYNELMDLSRDEDTPFYHVDQERNGEFYRIFSYHYTDPDSWLRASALEARGIMFRMTPDGHMAELVSRPMQKFFNKGEVDFINYGSPMFVMEKADGSLISSYETQDNEIRLKSKTSVTSDYAMYAEELLYSDAYYTACVFAINKLGYTVNFELVSPDPFYRIVVFYDRPRLIVLNARHRITGDYMAYQELIQRLPGDTLVRPVDISELNTLDTAVGIEGFVVQDSFGNWWKEKTRWYLERHRAKDFVNSPRAFVELVLKDEADDVMQLMADQPGILEEMRGLQHMVVSFANTVVNQVTDYWKENRDLSRKDYAIKAKGVFTDFRFSLAMMYYSGEEPNWTDMLLRQVKKMEFDDNELRISS